MSDSTGQTDLYRSRLLAWESEGGGLDDAHAPSVSELRGIDDSE